MNVGNRWKSQHDNMRRLRVHAFTTRLLACSLPLVFDFTERQTVPTDPTPMDMEMLSVLKSLQRRPKIQGWALKLQVVSEQVWTSLQTDEASSDLIALFCDVLHCEDSFDIARLVVPELRGHLDRPTSLSQQRVLDLTADLRNDRVLREKTTQASFDDAEYCEEKDVLLDAEITRASLLLHSGGALDPATALEIRTWLRNGPGKKVNSGDSVAN